MRDGFQPQTNIVRHDGQRAVLLTILKYGNASTLDIVDRVKAELPRIQAGLPPALEIQTALDQSIFVRAAVDGVIYEAILAGLPDRADDPAVPRQLAQHADHRGLDSAVHPDLASSSCPRWARPSTS